MHIVQHPQKNYLMTALNKKVTPHVTKIMTVKCGDKKHEFIDANCEGPIFCVSIPRIKPTLISIAWTAA